VKSLKSISYELNVKELIQEEQELIHEEQHVVLSVARDVISSIMLYFHVTIRSLSMAGIYSTIPNKGLKWDFHV